MSELKRLKLEIFSIRSMITRTKTLCSKLLKGEKQISEFEIKERVKKLDEMLAVLGPAQNEVVVSTDLDGDELEKILEKNAEYEDKIFSCREILSSLISESHTTDTATNNSDKESDIVNQLVDALSKVSVKTVDSKRVKAPHVVVPKFSGSFEDWLSFRNVFISVIDKNDQLSDTEKMQHLTTSLHGEAKELISHFSISEENYAVHAIYKHFSYLRK